MKNSTNYHLLYYLLPFKRLAKYYKNQVKKKRNTANGLIFDKRQINQFEGCRLYSKPHSI